MTIAVFIFFLAIFGGAALLFLGIFLFSRRNRKNRIQPLLGDDFGSSFAGSHFYDSSLPIGKPEAGADSGQWSYQSEAHSDAGGSWDGSGGDSGTSCSGGPSCGGGSCGGGGD